MDYPSMTEQELINETPYNAAEPAEVNKARKVEARRRKRELEVVKAIMGTPQGREWMNNLLKTCKVFVSPIVAGDTHFTYHNIGEQNIGKKLLQDIGEASPDEYIIMLKEAREAAWNSRNS